MKKLLVLLLIILLSSCSESYTKYSATTLSSGFDTLIQISLYTKKKEDFDEVYNEATSNFEYLNKLFDIYHTYDGVNNLKTINDNAGIKEVEVDPIIIDILKLSNTFYTISNEEFDISYGPVLKIWHNYREEGMSLNHDNELGKVPSKDELVEASKCAGIDNLVIDESKNTVFLKNKCNSIDLGGIAKGYATEYVARIIESNDKVKSGFINAGGNNRTINSKPDGSSWKVGIQDPTDLTKSIVTINVDGSMSFVTSGNYQRFYIGEDEKIYHHIIDTKTLFPSTYYDSVSIITNDSGYADGFSTSLYNLTIKEGLEIIEQFKKDNPDKTMEVIWISKDNLDYENSLKSKGLNIYYTDGLKDNIELVQ